MRPEMLARDGVVVQSSHRILVADDNEVLLAAIGGLLRGLGHSVEAVSDGHEAVMAARQESFDLAFLDIQMPVVDGLVAARSLRDAQDEGHPLAIIGMSGEPVDYQSIAAAGMDDFLLKPVSLANLSGAIRSHSNS